MNKRVFIPLLSTVVCLASLQLGVYGKSNSSAAHHKVLSGGVSDTGIFSEDLQSKLGIGVMRLRGKLIIGLVVAGKGANAGLMEGDLILEAKADKNSVFVKILRDGQTYESLIDLNGGQAKNTFVPSQKRSPGAESGGVGLERYAEFGTWQTIPRERFKDKIKPREGWTPERVEDFVVWSAEYGYVGYPPGPLHEDWEAIAQKARDLLTDYVRRYWPNNVLGRRSYHLEVARDGTILQCWPESSRNFWANDEKQWARYVNGALDGLSKAHVLAVPPASRVKKWQTTVGFINRPIEPAN